MQTGIELTADRVLKGCSMGKQPSHTFVMVHRYDRLKTAAAAEPLSSHTSNAHLVGMCIVNSTRPSKHRPREQPLVFQKDCPPTLCRRNPRNLPAREESMPLGFLLSRQLGHQPSHRSHQRHRGRTGQFIAAGCGSILGRRLGLKER